ncbi:MAG: PASTA domain-containing protein [Pseudonocardiaceae bacterium]
MAGRWKDVLSAGWVRDLRDRRAGTMVLIGAVVLAVFAASVGAGYTVSRPLNDTGGAVLAKGNTVAYVNGESARVEAEARALAPGKAPLETVTLSDGRVAVVDNESKQVWIVDTATMEPQGAPITRGTGEAGTGRSNPRDALTVVAGQQHSYLVDAGAGTVEEIDPRGMPRSPIHVPGGARTAVPDGADGVWVLNNDGMVVHVRDGQVQRQVDTGGRVEHLTMADGGPIAITDSGELLHIGADPLVGIAGGPVPHGPNVTVGSPQGAGRWILIVDERAGELIAVDPRTGTRQVFSDLPPNGPEHNLGEPVIVGDTVYIPDHAAHLVYVRNAATGETGRPIEVPGSSSKISLEVHGEKVWANDQNDRRAVVIGPDGKPRSVDKGTGKDLTDTTNPQLPTPGSPSPGPVSPAPEPAPPVVGPPPPVRSPPPPAGEPGRSPFLPAPPEPDPDEPRVPEQVTVPDIRPGTNKDDACRRIEEAGLPCSAVAAGSDGPTNEVIDTDPPGGTRVPAGHRVLVRHYGPTTVPDVISRFTADACRAIEASGLSCASQPNTEPAASPSELDVVATQDPAARTEAATQSPVTVRYWDRAALGDYRNRPGAEACAELKATYRRVECVVVEGQTEAQSGLAPGVAYDQSPTPGAAVRMGETVTITVVKTSQHVPPVEGLGLSKDQACQRLAEAGYGCDARADVINRNAVVTAQDTRPGTAMDGGTVVIHYSPYEPVALRLYKSDTGDPVFTVRPDGQPYNRYSQPGDILGYGYAAEWDQPGSWMIWDHYCTSNKNTCLGWSSNHYQSRDNQIYHSGWDGPQETARFIAPAGAGTCAAGQIPMYRFANFKDRDRDYIVGTSAPAGYTDYQEFLGCLWSP